MDASSSIVAIADDSGMYRYLLKKRIAEMPGFQIHSEAANGEELIGRLQNSLRLPDICILDIGMPVMDGYAAIAVMRKKWPSIKVLVFSAHYHSYAVNTMIQSGARGFISKEDQTDCLCEALLSIKETGYYYSKHAPKELYEQVEKGKLPFRSFTPVERKLLAYFSTDMQYSEIAKKLFTSVHTLQKHKQNIFKKTGVNSREGLMLFAIKNELV